MKKSILFILTMFLVTSGFAQTAVWDPAANDPSDGLWSTAANWTTAAVPVDIKVVFNVADAMACTVDSDVGTITQLVQGDGGDGSTLIIANGGVLSTTTGWSGIGWNDTANLVVEAGGVFNFGSHMWTGHNAAAMATIDISGTINVADNFGLGRSGGKSTVTIHTGGLLSVRYCDAPSISGDNYIDLRGGILEFLTDQQSFVNTWVSEGKIIGYSGGGTVNVEFTDGKTIVTANADETAPTVLSTNPVEGATDVPGAASIEIEFSEPMNQASVEGAITTDIPNPVYSWEGNTLIISGDEMTALQSYSVTVGTGAMDKNDLALAEAFTLNFTIVDPNAPPTIVSTNPADAAVDVDPTSSIEIVFSKAMNTTDVESKVSTPDMTNVTYAWTNSDKTLTISCDQLAWEATYTVTVAATAQAADATELAAEYSFSFTTIAQPLTTIVWAPATDGSSDGLWTTAENWSLDVVADGNYKVVFNIPEAPAAVLDAEVNINKIVMGDGAAGDTLIIADGGNLTTRSDEWSAIGYDNPATLVVEEGGELTIGNHMWIGLNAGGDANVHVNGGTVNNVDGMFGLNFQGNGTKDTLFLNSGTVNLNNFHETQSVRGESQIIIDEGMLKIKGNKVPIINDYYIANDLIVMAGDVGGLIVEHGGAIDSTYIYVDKTAPSVSEVAPADASVDIALDSVITVVFSEAMTRTATEGAITVSPELTGMYFMWPAGTNGTTLEIAGDAMANGTEYTVTVGTGATDLAGNALAADYSFSFTTIALPTYTVTFNVSDANGALAGADVTFQSATVTTDASGVAAFTEIGAVTDAAYTVTKTGYEDASGTVSVVDADVTENVTMTELPNSVSNASALIGNIYPNPATDKLNIKLSRDVEHLEIINTLGKVVYTKNKISQSEIVKVDVAEFESGMYFIRTQQKDGITDISKIMIK